MHSKCNGKRDSSLSHCSIYTVAVISWKVAIIYQEGKAGSFEPAFFWGKEYPFRN